MREAALAAGRLLLGAGIATAGGALLGYMAFAMAMSGSSCFENGPPCSDSSLNGDIGLALAGAFLVAGTLAVLFAGAWVALGPAHAAALGRLRLAGIALLLVPMYPAMVGATIVTARHVRLDFTPGLGVVGIEAAVYLAAWAAIARLITPRRHNAPKGGAQAMAGTADTPSQE
jgi:hypothetical protein